MAEQGNIEQIFPLVGMNTDDDPRFFQEGDYLEALNVKVGSNQSQGDNVLVQTLKSTLARNLEDAWSVEQSEFLGVAIDSKNRYAYIFNYQYYDAGDNDYQDRFIIYKHDIEAGTNKIILNVDASVWGIKAWDSDMLRIEAEVVDDKLIFTDDTNDIRMIDVNRIEVSTDNDITDATIWNSSAAGNEGYDAGTQLYHLHKVYEVSQFVNVTTEPQNLPAYYTELCDVVDCYLKTTDPDLFILAASPPLTSPDVSYQTDSNINANKLRGSVWQFSFRYIYMDYRKSKYTQPSIIAEPDGEEYNTGAPYTDQTHNNRLRITCSIRNEDIRAIELVGRSSEDTATWFYLGTNYIVNEDGEKLFGAENNTQFLFYNDQSKIPITLTEVYELFPYVPITAKTLSLLENNRLVFGNIKENYGLIETDISVSLAWETLTAGDPLNKHRALKKGVTHQWGIVYRDIAGRITPIMGEDEMKLYVPYVTESSSSNIDRRPTVSFEINHVPHSDAVSYEIVKLGNSLNGGNTFQLSFFQIVGYNIFIGKLDHEDESVASGNLNFSYYRLEISRAFRYARENILNWSLEEYVWQKGDRIKIIGKTTFDPVTDELYASELSTLFDLEIVGVFTDTDNYNTVGEELPDSGTDVQNDWIYFPRTADLTTALSSPSGTNQLFVEIYRPLTSDPNWYFTTDMVFEIGIDGNGNKYHKGDTDQVLTALGEPSTPAIIQNTSHDVWMYQRTLRVRSNAENKFIWVESDYPSDYYDREKMTSQGQSLTDINISGTGLLPERLRHGGTLEIGTQVNNIANFGATDFKDLQVKYGPITKIVLAGFILKAVQEHKVTSIYISRQESFTASGEPTYTFTDRVFGTVRPFKEDWGSRHPGSIIEEDGVLYFWNSKDRIIVENDSNSQEAISNNKMTRLFSDLADTLEGVSAQNQWVEFAISKDDFNNTELFCLFGTGTSTKRIYVFNTRTKRWTYKIDLAFNYSRFFWLGDKLFHLYTDNIVENVIYEWWAGANYQVIGGDQRNGVLNVNSMNGMMRIFNTIVVYQDGATPLFTSVSVPKKVSGANRDMDTFIYAVNIEEKEGMYYCSILNDINTPGAGTQNYKLMNGDVLRGLFLNIVMSFTGNDKITLSNIKVVTTVSELKM